MSVITSLPVVTKPAALSNKLTHSRMSAAKTCLKKHYFLYELGIRRDTDARPLRMGSAFHLGLDLWFKGVQQDAAIYRATESYAVLPAWCNTDELVNDWLIEREKVARLLSGYFWRWGDAKLEVIASELPFELPIENPETGFATPTFVLAGKIDRIVRLPDGRLAVKESKTCSDDLAPDSDYWRRLRIDQQISLYYDAAQRLGYDVKTVLYDVTRKPTIEPLSVAVLDPDGVKIVLDAAGNRVRNKDGKSWRQSGDAAQGWTLQTRRQTPAEYGERLTDDIAARPDFYFARQEIPRLDADLAEWKQELWDQQLTLRRCQKMGCWYRNTAACISPFRCEFLDVCHNGLTGSEVPAGFVKVENVHPEL